MCGVCGVRGGCGGGSSVYLEQNMCVLCAFYVVLCVCACDRISVCNLMV